MKKEDELQNVPIIDYSDIERLKILSVAYKTGNFTEAAKNLNSTQSAVSKAISFLEKKLGFLLFYRKSHSVEATDENKDLQKYIQKILSSIQELETYLQIKDTEAAGRLKIFGGDNSLATLVIESLEIFKEKHPQIDFDIIGTNDIPIFLPSQLMVGLFGPITNQPDVIQEYLMSFHLGLYASETYLKKYGSVSTIKDLDNHRLMVFENHGIPFSYLENWLLEIGKSRDNKRKPYLTVNTIPLTYAATYESLGISLIQKESYFIKNSNLIELLPEIAKPTLKLFCSYHTAHKANPSIIAFQNQIKEIINKKGWHS